MPKARDRPRVRYAHAVTAGIEELHVAEARAPLATRQPPTLGNPEDPMPRYGAKTKKTVESAMRRRKKGTLKSGRSGKKVTSRKQAIAIGLSEARKKGAKVPRKRSSRGGKKK
jgi:hypothetical protein